MEIDLQVSDLVDDRRIFYVAAAPAYQGYSYSGSGMPFACREMAIHGTPNRGEAILDDEGKFTCTLPTIPNSYHGADGTLIPPTLELFYHSKGVQKKKRVPIAPSIPWRTSMGLSEEGAREKARAIDLFPERPAASQEAILRTTRTTR